MRKITTKQVSVLKAINAYKGENKVSPTYRELNDIVGLASTSTMHGYIMRLKRDGLITSLEKIPRSLVLTDLGKKLIIEEKK